MQIISDHFQKTPAIQIPKGIFQSGRLRQPSIGHDQSQGLRTRMPIVLSSKLLWYIYIISSWAILKIAEIRPLGRWGPHNPSSCSMFDIVWHIYNFTHTHTTHTYTVCIYIYIMALISPKSEINPFWRMKSPQLAIPIPTGPWHHQNVLRDPHRGLNVRVVILDMSRTSRHSWRVYGKLMVIYFDGPSR
jgi:hypothetical protein